MAYTTQYIGSRYVPLFADPAEWDSARTYEPLTIVMHDGNSYTSRQYVPAGIEITNEKFWALTGNYNAQVEAYRKEVLSISPLDNTPTEGSTKGVTSDGIAKAITNAVAEETSRATDAEQNNTDAISAETTRAKAAEQALQTSIDAEKTRAENAEKILESKFTHKYNTVNDMIADSTLSIGNYCYTTGFNTSDDGGAASYIISANAADVLAIRLDNGYYANYVFGKTMNAAQFPYALNSDIYSLFMKSNANVLDLNNQTLTAPCTNGTPSTDKTIKNGNITVSGYMFSIKDQTFNGNLVLENLDIQCSMSEPKTFTFSCPPNTNEFHVRNCHVYSNSPTYGWCPLYTIANTLEITGNYIDASNIPDNAEGGCIWALSHENNPARNTITITNNHLVANGRDEVLALQNNNFSYIMVANNLIEGISRSSNAQRNFVVTMTETTDTSNHGIIFFHDNIITGLAIDVQIEVQTLAICRNNYHPTGSYGLSATSDGREPSIDNELVASVKVRTAMTLYNCLITGYVNVASNETIFVGGMIGAIWPRETNAQFINCVLTDMPNNVYNCYLLDRNEAPVSTLNVGDRVLKWVNVNSNKPFYFQTQPSPESFISTGTDISRLWDTVLYPTNMNELPNCTFTISAPHLQGHKDAS